MESKKQTVTLEAGEGVVIYPGIVSNPEPNKDISKQNIAPIDLSWYMLASIENYGSLNMSISSNLEENLSNGPIVEGEFILTSSRLDTAIIKPNGKLLIDALKCFVSNLSYASTKIRDRNESIDINFTYQTLPEATMANFKLCSGIVEQYLLNFVISCALQNKWNEIDKLVKHISIEPEVGIRTDLISILKGNNINTTDAISYNSKLLMNLRSQQSRTPMDVIIGVFHHTLVATQIGINMKQSNLISRLAFESLKVKWLAIWGQQRYLLKSPNNHFANIDKALSVKGYSWPENVLYLMKAILPTLGVGDELEVNRTLDELLLKVRATK